MRPHSTLGGVALALALTATGCNGSDAPETDVEGTSTPSESPTTRAAPDPKSARDRAKADALAMLPRYFTVLDRVGGDPDVPLNELKSVTIATEFGLIANRYGQYREKGWRSTGKTRLVSTQVEHISLDNSRPEEGVVPYVLVRACIDVSEIDVVNAEGISQVDESRPDTFTDVYVVSNYSWSKSKRSGWKVSSTEAVDEGEPCDDS